MKNLFQNLLSNATYGYRYSKETADIYATQEPQAAFHARIAFCLDTHNEVGLYTCCIQLTHSA